MRHSLAAIACFGLALIVPQARADDASNAILVLEAGKVRLYATLDAPNEPLDPHLLADETLIRGGNEEGTLGGTYLRTMSDQGDIGVPSFAKAGLVLAYTNSGQFLSTQMLHLKGDPGQIEYGLKMLEKILAKAVPVVTERAQQLGGSTDGLRVTGLSVIDLNEDKTAEFVVAASSLPASKSAEPSRPGQFAGIFVVDANGAALGEFVQILRREDVGAKLDIRLAAAGRSSFAKEGPERWDFLIETVYERSDGDGNRTQHRTVDVRNFANGEFVKRPNLSFASCSGLGC